MLDGVILSFDGRESENRLKLEKAVLSAGSHAIAMELRTTGSRLGYPADKVGRSPDHNSAEWGLWLGRPLLGQWVFEVRQFLDAFPNARDENGKPASRT